MYINDSYCFTTLAIGKKYIDRSITLIQSILKFTNASIYVLTDDISAFGSYYGHRVVPIDINSLTTNPFQIKNIFNYNLKYYCFQYCVNNTDYKTIIYMDSDSFLFGWNVNFMYEIRDLYGLIARSRELISNMMDDNVVNEKITLLQHHDVQFPLVIENILILQRDYRTNDFIKLWGEIVTLSLKLECSPFMEAIELGIAAHLTSMNVHDINYRSFSDNFRTLHHDKIHIPLIS